jgi:hypothetical protein
MRNIFFKPESIDDHIYVDFNGCCLKILEFENKDQQVKKLYKQYGNLGTLLVK